MAGVHTRASVLSLGAAVARRVGTTGPIGLTRMGGSSIAAPSAAGWVTDFLNAAYYARPKDRRDVEDLRLALCVLNTSWYRRDRRLRLSDLADFHRAFGRDRLRGGPTLDRNALFDGAERLLGDGFAAGFEDPMRRGWGIVFRDAAERDQFQPELRLRAGRLRELTPPRRPAAEQEWHTYRPVPLPSAERALEVLATTERWPAFGSELGRFTAVRRGGLPGQTFEIELAARVTPRTPVFTRAYVTATKVLLREADPEALDRAAYSLAADMLVGEAQGDVRPMPPGATARALVELTTHRGHFLGRGTSRLFVFEHEGRDFIRDIGSWDPLPPHLAIAYRLGGSRAQRAFWGEGTPEQGLFQQLARLAA